MNTKQATLIDRFFKQMDEAKDEDMKVERLVWEDVIERAEEIYDVLRERIREKEAAIYRKWKNES